MGNANANTNNMYVFCNYQNQWLLIQTWVNNTKNGEISNINAKYGYKDMGRLISPVLSTFYSHISTTNTSNKVCIYNTHTHTGVHITATMVQEKVAIVNFELPCYKPQSMFSVVLTTNQKFNDATILPTIKETNVSENPATDWNLTTNYKEQLRDVVWDCCMRSSMRATVRDLVTDIVMQIGKWKNDGNVFCHKIVLYLHSKLNNHTNGELRIQDVMLTVATNVITIPDVEVDCADKFPEAEILFRRQLQMWFATLMDSVWSQSMEDIRSSSSDNKAAWHRLLNRVLQNMKQDIEGPAS